MAERDRHSVNRHVHKGERSGESGDDCEKFDTVARRGGDVAKGDNGHANRGYAQTDEHPNSCTTESQITDGGCNESQNIHTKCLMCFAIYTKGQKHPLEYIGTLGAMLIGNRDAEEPEHESLGPVEVVIDGTGSIRLSFVLHGQVSLRQMRLGKFFEA